MSPTIFEHLPKFYAYRHIRNDVGTPFYVGIGSQNIHKSPYRRAFEKKGRSFHWKNVVAKHGYNVEIFYESNSRSEIKEKEIEFIKLYKRSDLDGGALVNKSDGGDGGRGMSKKEIEALILRNKANKYNKGRRVSLISKKRMSVAKNGNMWNNATKKKPVVQCDRYGRTIAEFDSIRDAAKSLKLNKWGLSTCLKIGKKLDGFIFKYK